jgi:peptide/nickel transport system substrate-binding protein
MKKNGDAAQRAAAVAVVWMLALSVVSCSHVQSTSTPATSAVPDVLRIADISDPTSLDPMLTGADIAYQLSGYVLEYLVQLDDRGDVVPVLCERVPTIDNGDISGDGLTLTYHLRRGVRWSDGMPFTSSDVVASWRQVMNPRNNVVDREGYEEIRRIDTPDPYTAVLHLAHPFPPMPTRFFAGIQEGPIPVMPAHVIGGLKELNDAPFSSHPIGTGPFEVQSWIRNGPMTFIANPHYWQGQPGLRKIVFTAQPSTASELVELRTHEIDADFEAGGQRMPEYPSLTGMRVMRSPSLRLWVLDLDTGRAPLNDLQVRRAVAYAIDRASMLHRVEHDAGTLADEWLPAWSWAYTPKVPRYDYDPVRAESILAADGWMPGPSGVRQKNGVKLSLVFVGPEGNGAFKEGAELIQSYLAAVGFDVTIKLYPYGVVFDPSGPVKTGRFDLAYYHFSVNFDPSALDYDGCDRFPPNGVNDERHCDPAIDRAEHLALLTNDPAARKPLYAEIERMRMEDLAGVPLYFVDRVGVMSDRFSNYRPSSGIIPEWNAYQWTLR